MHTTISYLALFAGGHLGPNIYDRFRQASTLEHVRFRQVILSLRSDQRIPFNGIACRFQEKFEHRIIMHEFA